MKMGLQLILRQQVTLSITVRASSNAQIKVNDVVVENSTNDFTSTIPGLTINAIAANAGTNYDVTVALDTSAIQKKSRRLLQTTIKL